MDKTEKYGLIVVAAPSGTGKSTLCAKLLAAHPDRIALSISTTSRAPRGREVHGKEYFFSERNDFEAKVASQCFAEWAEVHGNCYGTEKATLERFWSDRKHVLLDIDVQGAESLRQAFPGRTFTIFIAPPSMEELERRLRGRGTESEASVAKRLANAAAELKRKNEFDLILVNDDLGETFSALEKSITQFMDELEGGLWRNRP